MKYQFSILLVVLLLLFNVSLVHSQTTDYDFELKTFIQQLPADVWRLYSTRANFSSVEYGGLASAGFFILWDQHLYHALHKTVIGDSTGWDYISLLGEPMLYGALGLTLVVNEHQLGKDLLYSVGMAGANTLLLKMTVGMARPYLNEGIKFIGPHLTSDYAAFPSGHTATAFSAATVFSNYYPEYAAWFWAGASLVGLSRIYQEKHWPSNVLFGGLLGYLSAKHVLETNQQLNQSNAEDIIGNHEDEVGAD